MFLCLAGVAWSNCLAIVFTQLQESKIGVILYNLLQIFCQSAQVLHPLRQYSQCGPVAKREFVAARREECGSKCSRKPMVSLHLLKATAKKVPGSSVKGMCQVLGERRGVRISQAFTMHCWE